MATVQAKNGKWYTRDHPHEITSPCVMSCAEIRKWLTELSADPEHGWTGFGGRAGLERALGMNPRTLKDKVTGGTGWIWPGEQRRLTVRIREILDGYIVPVRFSRSRVEGVCTDPPQPPRLSPNERSVPMLATVGSGGVRLQFGASPPRMKLPDFANAFKHVPTWDSSRKRMR